MNKDLEILFERHAKNYEEERTRIAIEQNIVRYLKEVHSKYFRNITYVHDVSVKSQRQGNVTRFIFSADGNKFYDEWYIDIQISPFMRNYDEWMKGGNDEWKQHVKPWSR